MSVASPEHSENSTPVEPNGGPFGPGATASGFLSVTLSPEGRRCTVAIAGTLDASSTAAIDTQYAQLVGAGFGEVVLDLSGIERLDESGAVAIAQLWSHLREHGVCCSISGLASKFLGSPIELLLFVRSFGGEEICEFCRQGTCSA